MLRFYLSNRDSLSLQSVSIAFWKNDYSLKEYIAMSDKHFDLSAKPDTYYSGKRHDMLRFIPKNVRTTLEFGCGIGDFSSMVKTTFKRGYQVEIINNHS